MLDADVTTLAKIICNYRKDELSFSLDENHVWRWLSQFSDDCQDTILKEMIFILQKWYFDESQFEDFYEAILKYLEKKMVCSEQEVIKRTCFVSLQNKGESQLRMLKRFSNIIKERYGLEIITSLEADVSEFVYIDDGLYTGNKARKDLEEVISLLPGKSDLDVFYLVAGMQGFDYSKKQLSNLASEKNVNIQWFRMHPLEDYKKVDVWVEDGTEIEQYSPVHSCLWPLSSVEESKQVKRYIDDYLRTKRKNDSFLFRYGHWINDPGIFSNTKNRNVVETEFLKKGVEIAVHSKDNGIYPLGFNSWPTLGFGSICASYMNISNTCPLVLWWGNCEKDGSILDAWYPLLPRRVGSNCEGYDFEDDMDDVISVPSRSHDQYNMCLDCGRYFGTQEDGGNGFCIDCAWRH